MENSEYKNMIDYDKFDFYYFHADQCGLISIDDCVSIDSNYMAIAEKDINPKVRIKFYGFGETQDEAKEDCKKTILDYSFPG